MRLLCQQKNETGCSACCGLFNLRDISRENLSRFLAESSASRKKNIVFESAEIIDNGAAAIRDITSHICPYQGYLDSGSPGCLLHETEAGRDMRALSLFGENICSAFLCPAHTLLNEDMKRALQNNVTDWYLYSIAVIDPLSYSWIYSRCSEIFPGRPYNDVFAGMINQCLAIHAGRLNFYEGNIFYYSISEYNLHRNAYSLSGGSGFSEQSRKIIIEFLQRHEFKAGSGKY